jgi:hypothetical protein
MVGSDVSCQPGLTRGQLILCLAIALSVAQCHGCEFCRRGFLFRHVLRFNQRLSLYQVEFNSVEHYAEFAEEESVALREAIKEYEANKWKVIGQKVGKPAKACEQYAKEHFKNL